MLKPLTLATARITAQPTYWLLEFMNSGSFLVGERVYASLADAREFCRERHLKIIEVVQ
jgi:hypothetical protein